MPVGPHCFLAITLPCPRAGYSDSSGQANPVEISRGELSDRGVLLQGPRLCQYCPDIYTVLYSSREADTRCKQLVAIISSLHKPISAVCGIFICYNTEMDQQDSG